jgi:uncharacterized protein YndB with AHSA1/START domain
MSTYGSVESDVGRAIVRFERMLDAAIDVVWDLIATGDGLEKWLAPSKVDLREGGTVDIDFGEEGLAGGQIVSLVEGTALEYKWQFPGEPDSIIRFELSETAGGTLYGAGWHAHLDHLEAVSADREPGDWDSRFLTLLPQYQALCDV